MSFITSYCHITNKACHVNGKLVAQYDPSSTDGWLKQLYKGFQLNYPKFYKMDPLAQAGYLSSELIKANHPDRLLNYKDDAIALVLANRHASVVSDLAFKNSYEIQNAPSPSLFVYTLPNIVLGEVAIANKWYGENMFAVLPKFAPEFYEQYADILLNSGSEAVLAGWLDITDSEIEVFMFLLEKSFSEIKFNTVNLLKLAENRVV